MRHDAQVMTRLIWKLNNFYMSYLRFLTTGRKHCTACRPLASRLAQDCAQDWMLGGNDSESDWGSQCTHDPILDPLLT